MIESTGHFIDGVAQIQIYRQKHTTYIKTSYFKP